METKDRANSTFTVERGHGGTEEHETPAIKRHRYHAGYGDSSGENTLPDVGGPVLIHQRDKGKRER